MKWILSVYLLCGTVAPVAAMDLNDKAGREEVKKAKRRKKAFGLKCLALSNE